MKVILVTPPLLQPNTPYPATPVLAGYLKSVDPSLEVTQVDLSLEMLLVLFSKSGLKEWAPRDLRAQDSVELALKVLRSKASSNEIKKVNQRRYFPEGKRFSVLRNATYRKGLFDPLPPEDKAKHLASLFLDDLADKAQKTIDSDFGFSRYAESLSASQSHFDPILKKLKAKPTLWVEWLRKQVEDKILIHEPDWVALTVPFAGNLLGALQTADWIKKLHPKTKVVMGGGYVNTELRELKDARLFDFVDYLVFDDGEAPLRQLLHSLPLKRTMFREKGKIRFEKGDTLPEVPMKDRGTPDYTALPIEKYFSMIESLNPVQRFWTESFSIKLTLAHGCYWKKCTFCDLSLDYIQRYEPVAVDHLIQQIQNLINQTGKRLFHFVDEAAPPALIRKLCEALLAKGISIQWWGNIRFDKAFTPELTQLMARAGCIAVTGGLEVADERLLKMIQKGVTLEQARAVTGAFRDAGIFVHAYLMYGYPSQTKKETLQSLEFVRQLFAENRIQSGFWHRLAVTAHSPLGQDPKRFGIKVQKTKSRFAVNDLAFRDLNPHAQHDRLSVGLKKALYNFMLGMGLDRDVKTWFKS